jgi:hypothetical protein
MKILLNNTEVEPELVNDNLIRIKKPDIEKWIIQIVCNGMVSELPYSLSSNQNTTASNIHLVIDNNVEFFEDSDLKIKCKDIKWVKLEVFEVGGRKRYQTFPTNNEYTKWAYLEWKFDPTQVCKESRWYSNNGKSTLAFMSATYFDGEVIGHKSDMESLGLYITPNLIDTFKDEQIPVKVFIKMSDWHQTSYKDVTKLANITVEDESVACFNNRQGMLYTNACGTTNMLVVYEKIHRNVPISVVSATSRVPIEYFRHGPRSYDWIAYHDKKLYLTTVSEKIFMLDITNGVEEEVLRLAIAKTLHGYWEAPPMIDRIFVDQKTGNIYFSSVWPWGLYEYNRSKGIVNPLLWPEDISWFIKGICLDSSWVIYLTTMTNNIIKLYPDGHREMMPIGILTVDVLLIKDEYLIVSSCGGGNLMKIYKTDWTFVNDIKIKELQVPTCMTCYGKDLYIAWGWCKNIYKFNIETMQYEIVSNLWSEIFVGGMTFDENWNLYIAASGSSKRTWIYKMRVY